MASVTQRSWRIPGQRTRRKAWGFTLTLADGRRLKSYRSEWTKEQAEAELAKAQLHVEQPKAKPSITFAQAVDRYLAAKSRKKSIGFDKLYLTQLTTAFGAETSLVEIT